MKNLISRPARGLLPVLAAVCTLLLPSSGSRAVLLIAAVMLARLCSLCAGAAFRIAAGEVVNTARLRGNFLTSMAVTFIGSALSVVLCSLDIPVLSDIGVWFALAGALINCAQLCSDRLYASYDNFSPPLFDGITAVLAAVGLLICAGDEWLMPVTVMPAAVAGAMLLYGLRSGRKVKPGFGVIKCIPAAVRNNALIQASLAGFLLFSSASTAGIAFTLAAMAMAECCESPFRRNDVEAAPLNVFISLFAIAVSLCAYLLSGIMNAAMFGVILFACMGILLTGTQLSLRTCLLLTGIMLLAAFTLDIGSPVMLCLAAAAAILLAILCTPDMVTIRRTARARRLQRRRRR